MEHDFEVAIIGGSIAGLSAAMTLGRSLRKTAVFDSGTACNRFAPRSHNFITADGLKPREILAKAREQVEKYDRVSFHDEEVTSVEKSETGFDISTRTKKYTSKRVLLATGLRDILPDIPGFSECWGISILHCPYCHGYECRDERTGIIANGEAAYHLGTLINNWTRDITVLTNGTSELRNEEREKLEKLGVKVIEKEIARIDHKDGRATEVVFIDGTSEPIMHFYASVPFEQQNDVAESLGCKMSGHGHVDVDDEQRTSIEGVYAAGDCTAQARAISVAAASGTKAGFTINVELILKD